MQDFSQQEFALAMPREFSEEAEVRIVAMPVSDEVYGMATKSPARRKPVEFLSRNGILVPHISLFGEAVGGGKLPVRRILVGPHPNRRK